MGRGLALSRGVVVVPRSRQAGGLRPRDLGPFSPLRGPINGCSEVGDAGRERFSAGEARSA